MTVNDAMLTVAKSMAYLYGYIEVEEPKKHNAINDGFWGNVALGIEAERNGQELEIISCLYIIPTFEEEKEGGCNGTPRININMYWGRPRLSVSLPDKTFACLTYKDGQCGEVQAFGPAGLELATSIKSQIDQLLK